MMAITTGYDFDSRDAFVSWAANISVPIGTRVTAAGLGYLMAGGSTALDAYGLSGWVPVRPATGGHFNGDLAALRAYLDGLANTETAVVVGTTSHSTPILYDANRSASWSGTTALSNLNDPGSITEYTGTGISRTVTSATNANPGVFTFNSHGFTDGMRVYARDASGGTWAATINGGPWIIGNVTTNTFTLADDTGSPPLDTTALGSLSSVVIRNEAAMGAFVITGSFMQSYQGFVMRTTQAVESIMTITAEEYINSTDFSGSITRISGMHFIPKTNDVTDALLRVSGHKFLNIEDSWFTSGVNDKPGIRLGESRTDAPNMLVVGSAFNTILRNNFLFADVVLENAEGVLIENNQFDSTSDPIRLRWEGDGRAECVTFVNNEFFNDGGADSTGLPAIDQPPADLTSDDLPATRGWSMFGNMFRDWPIGINLQAGMAKLSGNVFRGRQAGDIGIQIGEDAFGESVDHTNDFLQMLANGNRGIVDLRYKTVNITGATQANPVVVTAVGHHFQDGDRVRIQSVVGMTQINDLEFIVQGRTTDTFQLYSLDDAGGTSATVNGTAYSAYTSGGTVFRPYHWHRKNVGGNVLSVGHGAFVFDLALAQAAAITAGTKNVLNMFNVPITGGFYRITYGGVVDMAAVTGTVAFSLTVGAIGEVTDARFAFEHTGAASTEIPYHFSRVVYLPPQTSTAGETIRFRINPPGTVTLRGKSSGTAGQTYCQIERVS